MWAIHREAFDIDWYKGVENLVYAPLHMGHPDAELVKLVDGLELIVRGGGSKAENRAEIVMYLKNQGEHFAKTGTYR